LGDWNEDYSKGKKPACLFSAASLALAGGGLLFYVADERSMVAAKSRAIARYESPYQREIEETAAKSTATPLRTISWLQRLVRALLQDLF